MGEVFVRKVIHLATNFFGSTVVKHVLAELFVSYEPVVHTQEVPLFALLLERIRDVAFSVPWLLSVTVPVGSPFLYIVVRNRKEIHCVLKEFLILNQLRHYTTKKLFEEEDNEIITD